MEERKPMYEFDLGFMGKVICSADTASFLQGLVLLARRDEHEEKATCIVDAYDEILINITDALKSIGYYNEIL